jgi:hypothetical protein
MLEKNPSLYVVPITGAGVDVGGAVVAVASAGGGVVGSGGGAGVAQPPTNNATRAIMVNTAKACFFTSFPPLS